MKSKIECNSIISVEKKEVIFMNLHKGIGIDGDLERIVTIIFDLDCNIMFEIDHSL